MKVATNIVRIVLGLIYSLFALAFFFNMMPQQELEGPAGQFVTGMFVSGYLFPLVKLTELICGLALIAGRFVSLATVIIFPITLNIFLFHLFLAPSDMLVPVVLLVANIFVAFAYKDRYSLMLSMK